MQKPVNVVKPVDTMSEWPSDLFSSSLSEEHSGSALVIFTCGPCH